MYFDHKAYWWEQERPNNNTAFDAFENYKSPVWNDGKNMSLSLLKSFQHILLSGADGDCIETFLYNQVLLLKRNIKIKVAST